MKKIFTSFLMIIVTLGLVGVAAYAVVADSGTVTGLSISSGSADIKIGSATNPSTDDWATGLTITDILPGDTHAPVNFYIKNVSNTNVALTLKILLTTLPTGWGNELTCATQLKIDEVGGGSGTTGWKSFPQWQAGQVTLPGGTLAKDAERQFTLNLRVPTTYGFDETGYTTTACTAGSSLAKDTDVKNEVYGDSLTGSVFTINAER